MLHDTPFGGALLGVGELLTVEPPHWPTLFVVLFGASLIGILGFTLDLFIGRFVNHVRSGAGPWRSTVLRLAPVIRLAVGATSTLGILLLAYRLPPAIALAVALVLVLALGLAVVDLLRNVVAGVVVGIRRAYAVGDRIRVADHEGEVRHLGMRTTTLRRPDGTIIALPNRVLLNSIVENIGSEGRGAPVRVLVPLPPDMDLAAAKSLAFRAACVSKYVSVVDRPDVYVVHDSTGNGGLQLEVFVRAFDGRFADHLRSDVLELMNEGTRPAQGHAPQQS